MIGQLLDGYEVQQEAGRGSSATVYVARQRPVERYVALKVFDPLDVRSRDRLRAVLAELADLDHTNLLPIYASGTTGDQVYAVMRYMPAGTLQARLRAQRWPLGDIERLLSQVAAALDYAQQHGLAHGRLTPANILFDHAGNAFVADGGLAGIFDAPPTDYAAPELRRRPAPDLASAVCADAYSLGAILYELLTGKKPFEPDRDEERVNRRLALPPRPATLNSKVTPAIDAVVMKALAIDPAQRYQTPLELAEAFAQARSAQADTHAAAEVRRITTRHDKRDRRGWVFGLIGFLIVAAAIIGLATRSPNAANPVAAPNPIDTPRPTAVILPSQAATLSPTPVPPTTTNPAVPTAATLTVAAPLPATETSTVAPSPTPTGLLRRVTLTPTPSISIEPLVLMMPRVSDRTTLILTFRTFVSPPDSGPLGVLSLRVAGIDASVSEPIQAQVGSGEQTLRVGVNVDCRRVPRSLTTDQVLVTLMSNAGRELLSQTVQFRKAWCY